MTATPAQVQKIVLGDVVLYQHDRSPIIPANGYVFGAHEFEPHTFCECTDTTSSPCNVCHKFKAPAEDCHFQVVFGSQPSENDESRNSVIWPQPQPQQPYPYTPNVPYTPPTYPSDRTITIQPSNDERKTTSLERIALALERIAISLEDTNDFLEEQAERKERPQSPPPAPSPVPDGPYPDRPSFPPVPPRPAGDNPVG